jgi:hypothetical protein
VKRPRLLPRWCAWPIVVLGAVVMAWSAHARELVPMLVGWAATWGLLLLVDLPTQPPQGGPDA